jgi:hypothetical protein
MGRKDLAEMVRLKEKKTMYCARFEIRTISYYLDALIKKCLYLRMYQ